jgi:hypothetical protein
VAEAWYTIVCEGVTTSVPVHEVFPEQVQLDSFAPLINTLWYWLDGVVNVRVEDWPAVMVTGSAMSVLTPEVGGAAWSAYWIDAVKKSASAHTRTNHALGFICDTLEVRFDAPELMRVRKRQEEGHGCDERGNESFGLRLNKLREFSGAAVAALRRRHDRTLDVSVSGIARSSKCEISFWRV